MPANPKQEMVTVKVTGTVTLTAHLNEHELRMSRGDADALMAAQQARDFKKCDEIVTRWVAEVRDGHDLLDLCNVEYEGDDFATLAETEASANG